MSKPVILTGLRANNDLHLGNYLGAMLPMVDMANEKSEEFQINMFIPDLHSFTTPIDHTKLQQQILQNARLFAAAGLNLANDSIFLYRQSYIQAHSELTIILNSFTGFGEMLRMTQFKDKSRTQDVIEKIEKHIAYLEDNLRKFESKDASEKERIQLDYVKDEFFKTIDTLREIVVDDEKRSHVSVGLFDYPVLMAADILLYGATYVPVGDDQTQHLEFTRDIAGRMNAKFGDLFVIPKPVKDQHAFFGKDQGLRVRDLQDPSKKMSKSDESGKGVIFLGDEPETAKKKVMSAATDSEAIIAHDYIKQPGISNLLDIYQHLGGDIEEFIGQDQYGPFKAAVANRVELFLQDFQSKLAAVDNEALLKKLEDSETAMRAQANETLAAVQKAVGLR